MKIIFFGTPIFAEKNLKHLIQEGYDITAIVTSPDSRKGRGKKIKACAVKEAGLTHNIPTLQPLKLKDESFIQKLKNFNADIFVVVAFRMLPEIVWNIPNKGTINLHTSLLPNYRGAAPINHVLINGEKETGVSTFFIDHNIDSGAIILQERVQLSEETTAAQLHNTLIQKGGVLLQKTLDLLQNSKIKCIKQNLTPEMKEAPKLTKDILKINWGKSARKIHNLVRGLSPFLTENTTLKNLEICPSAWFIIEDKNQKQKRVKLHLTEIIQGDINKGTIETDNKSYLHIGTKESLISILILQMEGKKPMKIQDFLQGNKLNKNFKVL